MEEFADVLRVGGRTNSLGRSAEVLELVRRDPARVDELVACTLDDDAWVRMRAMDVLEKLCRADPVAFAPRVPALFASLRGSTQPSVRWHLAQVLGQVPLAPPLRTEAVGWLLGLVSTVEVDWIVSVNAMKTLQDLARRGWVGLDEVEEAVVRQAGHRSASVRRHATRIAAELGA